MFYTNCQNDRLRRLVAKGMIDLAFIAAGTRVDRQKLVVDELVAVGRAADAASWLTRLQLTDHAGVDADAIQQQIAMDNTQFLHPPWEDFDAHVVVVDSVAGLAQLDDVLFRYGVDVVKWTIFFVLCVACRAHLASPAAGPSVRVVALDSEWPCALYGSGSALRFRTIATHTHTNTCMHALTDTDTDTHNYSARSLLACCSWRMTTGCTSWTCWPCRATPCPP